MTRLTAFRRKWSSADRRLFRWLIFACTITVVALIWGVELVVRESVWLRGIAQLGLLLGGVGIMYGLVLVQRSRRHLENIGAATTVLDRQGKAYAVQSDLALGMKLLVGCTAGIFILLVTAGVFAPVWLR